MNIKIICVGSLKEKYWKMAIEEYIKRLSRYCKPVIIEVDESRLPSNPSVSDEMTVVKTEGKKIISKIGEGDFVIAMSLTGDEFSSSEFAAKLEEIAMTRSTIDFIIGGSLGLSDEILRRADMEFCLGKVTLPHQLARVVVAEQIYRAYKINNNEKYHK